MWNRNISRTGSCNFTYIIYTYKFLYNMEGLLPGFRFYPTEEELVSFYLPHKLDGTKPEIDRVIPVVDIYNYNPWDLPKIDGGMGSGLSSDGEQWFFFIPRQEREGRGGRPNRLTAEGYWKATGSPCDVYSSKNCIVVGRKRSMVFYAGRAPNGTKTDWKMNEYKAIDHHQPASASAYSFSSSSSIAAANPQLREEFSLCRIYRKSRNSLWAFDRRPPVRGDQGPAHHHHHGGSTTDDAAALVNYGQSVMSAIPDQTTADSSISEVDNINIPSQPSSQEHGDWDSQHFDWFDT